MKFLSLLFVFSLSLMSSFAQDMVITSQGDTLNVIIKEVTDRYVTYKRSIADQEVTIQREEVAVLLFGPKSAFRKLGKSVKRMDDPYQHDHKNIIKVNPNAFFNTATKLYYQRALSRLFSSEVGLTVFGAFAKPNFEKKGFAIEGVLKINMARGFSSRFRYPHHLLSGLYLGLVAGYTDLNENIISAFDPPENQNRRYFQSGLDLGLQLIRNEYLAFEIYVGLARMWGKSEVQFGGQNNPMDLTNFKDADLSVDGNQGTRFGFKLGYVFGDF